MCLSIHMILYVVILYVLQSKQMDEKELSDPLNNVALIKGK